MNDPFVGNLTFFRVYSGTLTSGTSVLNSTRGKRERIGRILRMHANKREELNECNAGNIYAAVGLRDTRTGDTLCDEKHADRPRAMIFPEPVISIAIEPKTKADRRQARRQPAEARLRGPVVPHLHQRGDRADHHRRHGRAPPRDHRRPPAARVQGRGQRRQARGRLPRGDRARRSTAEGKYVAAVRRPRPVRPRAHRDRARRARHGLRLRERHRRRRHPEGVHPVDREGRPRGAWGAAFSPAIPVDRRASAASTTAATTRSTRRGPAFEIAASMAFQDGAKRAGSAPARADDEGRGRRRPSNTWATSSAT